MRKLLLVANPSASGFTGAALRDVENILADGFEVVTVWPNGPAESRQAAADAAADGFSVVAAMGGDGVAHHVANGLAFTSTALGIIPTGTTNVVARILGIPRKPARAAARLLVGQRRLISLAHIATEAPLAARSEYALFSLGMGLDADVVAVSDQRPTAKYHFSSLNFAAIAAKQVLTSYRGRLANMLVEGSGHRIHATSVLVQVHDIYTYWGRLALRLTPDPGEGLTALSIERVALLPTIGLAARGLLRQDLNRQAGAHVWQDFDKLVIQAEPGAAFQADGELLGTTDAVEITPAYDALAVVVDRRD